jgi:hypothetical protein
MAEHIDEDRLDQLVLTIAALNIAALNLAPENDRYLLRARIAQELRRIIETLTLNNRREIVLVLKPASGYRAEMTFRNDKFDTLRLTDVETGDVTDVDRFLFLSAQHYLYTNSLRPCPIPLPSVVSADML